MRIKAYHGTSLASAQAILSGEDYYVSKNGDEWLGEGIYFFIEDYACRSALKWAYSQKKETPTVLENIINLGEDDNQIINFNLGVWQEIYKQFRIEAIEKWGATGHTFETTALLLDYAIIALLCKSLQPKAIIQQRYARVLEDFKGFVGSNIPNCTILCIKDVNIIEGISLVLKEGEAVS